MKEIKEVFILVEAACHCGVYPLTFNTWSGLRHDWLACVAQCDGCGENSPIMYARVGDEDPKLAKDRLQMEVRKMWVERGYGKWIELVDKPEFNLDPVPSGGYT